MQKEQDLCDNIGRFEKIPEETFKNIEGHLGIREIVRLSETCKFFEEITRKERAISKVRQFLNIFNDVFITLPFEKEPELLNALLQNYLELNAVRLHYYNENGTTFSEKLEKKCNSSSDSTVNYFLEKFEAYKNQKSDNEKTQSKTAPSFEAYKNQKSDNKKTQSKTALSNATDIQRLIIKIVGTINLHFLSTLYYKQKRYFDAWITAFNSFLNSCQSGYHHSSLIASLHYLHLLSDEEYVKAAKIIGFAYNLPTEIIDEATNSTERPKLISLLLHNWLYKIEFFDKNFSDQQKNLVIKIFFTATKTETFYNNFGNILRNLKPAHAIYKDTLLTKFEDVFPYLLHCKDLRPIFSKLTIDELVSLDSKLLGILAETIPAEKIQDCVNFIKQNYTVETIHKICTCPYSEFLFACIQYQELRTYDMQPQTEEVRETLLDELIKIMKSTYALHYLYPYSPDNSTILDEDYNNNITKYGNEFSRISKIYSACVIEIYLLNYNLNTVSTLISFNYPVARYLLSFRKVEVLLEAAENCSNLLQYLSKSVYFSIEVVKPELVHLYKIHKQISKEQAEEFYKAHIENLSNEQLQRLCDCPLINRLDQRINALLKVFEVDMFVNPPAKPELMKLLAAQPPETLIALHEKNLFALYDSLTLSTATYLFGIYLVTIKEQNFENLERCLKHPMLSKINLLAQNLQGKWFRLYEVISQLQIYPIYGQPGIADTYQTFFLAYLNFLEDLDNHTFFDKLANSSLSIFDFFTRLAEQSSDDFVDLFGSPLWQFLTHQEEDDIEIAKLVGESQIIDEENSTTTFFNQETQNNRFAGPAILAINQDQLDKFLEIMQDLFSKIGLESVKDIFIKFSDILQDCKLENIYNFINNQGLQELQQCYKTYQALYADERNNSTIYQYLELVHPKEKNSANTFSMGN